MGLFQKVGGTSSTSWLLDALNTTAVRVKQTAGKWIFRNKADTAFAPIAVSTVDINDAGTAFKTTIVAGTQAADLTVTLPVNAGSAGQVLQTNGAGVTSWVAAGSTAALVAEDTTSLAFGTASPLTLFTLPANAVVKTVRVVVDTAFNGTATMSVGIAGTTSKYMGTGDLDLLTANEYEVAPGLVADGTTNALIVTYSAGGASAGAARIILAYSIPS